MVRMARLNMWKGVSLISRALRLRRLRLYLPDSPAVRRQTKLYTRVCLKSRDPRSLQLLPKACLEAGDMSRNSPSEPAGADSAHVLGGVFAVMCGDFPHECRRLARSQSWYLGCNLLVVVQRLETFHSTGEHAIIRISPYGDPVT
jgi:hypothetical protein